LDDELGLLPGALSPTLAEGAARLGSRLPSFAEAAAELAAFTRVTVDAETVRRVTEATGGALVAVAQAEEERLRADPGAPPAGAALLSLSVDGALLHTREEEWKEVRTV